jgi:hypothetical protein
VIASACIAAGSWFAEVHAQEPRLPAVSITSALQPLIDVAIADLAQRLAIDPAAVSVAEAMTVVWPDRSLGCPRPDMQYLQVPQDGFLIRLRAQGRTFSYHGGGSRAPFLCESPDRRGAAAGR